MAIVEKQEPRAKRRRLRQDGGFGLRLGRFAGVEVIADWSLIVILGLIVVSLGTGLFGAWAAAWGSWTSWLLAVLAAAAFGVAVVLHELAHAVVANRNRVAVREITLFLFGGMARMEGEPPSPGAELRIAVAGPIASLVVGAVATLAGYLAARPVLMLDQPLEDSIAALSPVAVLLLWFGPMNLLLAAFNAIPGFPMDGGRVLRALLWKISGNLERATLWASRVGRGVAWSFMALGVAMMLGLYVPLLGGGPVAGIWMLLLGVFLDGAARASYRQLFLQKALDNLPVRAVMRTRVDPVSPDTTLQQIVDSRFGQSEMDAAPVVDDGDRLLGLVHVETIRRIGRDHWSEVRAADAMTPASDLRLLRPDDPAIAALRELERNDPIPVVGEGEHVVGMVRAPDLVRWIELHADEASM